MKNNFKQYNTGFQYFATKAVLRQSYNCRWVDK